MNTTQINLELLVAAKAAGLKLEHNGGGLLAFMSQDGVCMVHNGQGDMPQTLDESDCGIAFCTSGDWSQIVWSNDYPQEELLTCAECFQIARNYATHMESGLGHAASIQFAVIDFFSGRHEQ